MVEQKRTTILIFFIAVLLNYLWELAQAPLYAGMESYTAAVFWHCFVASLGDGVMVVLIVAVGWLVLRRQNWFEHPGVPGYLVMLATGFLLAVLVERIAVHQLGRWQYMEKMPMVPGLGIGIVPLAQMLFLPPLIFRAVVFLARKE